MLTSTVSAPATSPERLSEPVLLQRLKEGRFFEVDELLSRHGDRFPSLRRIIDATISSGALQPQDAPAAVAVIRALLQNGLADGSAFHALLVACLKISSDTVLVKTARRAMQQAAHDGRHDLTLPVVRLFPPAHAAWADRILARPFLRQAAELFLKGDRSASVDEIAGRPLGDAIERLHLVADKGGDIVPADADLVATILSRRDVYANLRDPRLQQLFESAVSSLPDNPDVLRAWMMRLRSDNRMREAVQVAHFLVRRPERTLTDLFYLVDGLTKIDRLDVIERYLRWLELTRARGTMGSVALAERYWAALRPATALEVLGADPDHLAADTARLEIALRSLITLRRFSEAEDLLDRAQRAKVSFSPRLGQTVRDASGYLRRAGIVAPIGTDSALAVISDWLRRAAGAETGSYDPVARRVLISTYSLGIGGAERQVSAIALGLSSDPDVESTTILTHRDRRVTYNHDERFRVEIESARELEAQLAGTLPWSVDDGSLAAEVVAKAPLFGLNDLPRCMAAVWHIRPEVVHIRSGVFAPMSLAALILGTPRVLLHFGSMTRRHQSRGTDQDEMSERLIEHTVAAAAAFPQFLVAANSRVAAEDWAEATSFPVSRMHVLYNGLDAEAVGTQRTGRPIRDPDASPVLGTVSRFAPVKDPLLWVEVARRVAQDYPNIRLLLVGDGPMRPKMVERLAACGLLGQTEMPGLVTTGIGAYLRQMDVFMMTSRTESLPNSIIEAQLAGIPVVSTDVGGVSEAVASRDAATLIADRDPEALAQAVLAFLRDPERRRRIAAEAPGLTTDRFSLARQLAATRTAYGWQTDEVQP